MRKVDIAYECVMSVKANVSYVYAMCLRFARTLSLLSLTCPLFPPA